jgi:hypothetical protein
VEDPHLITEACRRYRESIIVGIDARDGLVATRGWVKHTGLTALELAKSMVKIGVSRFIYTDIQRDGTLTEPNFSAIAEMPLQFQHDRCFQVDLDERLFAASSAVNTPKRHCRLNCAGVSPITRAGRSE